MILRYCIEEIKSHAILAALTKTMSQTYQSQLLSQISK